MGPAIGGFFADHIDPRAPFFVAAALALANVIFGYFVLPESLPPERRRKFEWARANPFGAFKSLAHLPMVAGLLVAVFLYQMAHDSLPAVWMFYTQHKFGWGPDQVGLFADLRRRHDGDRHGWIHRVRSCRCSASDAPSSSASW